MNRFLTWFVVSSNNPNEFSMTLKGVLLAQIGVIMWGLHYASVHYAIPTYSLEQVTDIIGVATGFLGSAMATAGMLRKLYNLVVQAK